MCAAVEQGPSFAAERTSSSLLDSYQTTRRKGGVTPRRMSNPLGKPTYIVYVYYGVGNDSAEGTPVLVTGRDNGRGAYFGRNFSRPHGGRARTKMEERQRNGEECALRG